MPTLKSRAIRLQALPESDGLHLVIPPSITRLVTTERPSGPVDMYGVVVGETIQISIHRLSVAIPAIDPADAAFEANPQA